MNPRLSPLASALLLAFSMPAIADTVAETVADGADTASRKAVELDTIEVHEDRIAKPSSAKYTEPLRDTPQTITVVTKAVMDQQNLLGLRDILSTLPGITFGAGEGGGGYGDSINLRGFSASSDITIDGVRDSAQYTRSDSFNLESLELINGANSAHSGAGSVGGNINLVSKTAREGDFSAFTLGAGTADYARATADHNIDFDNGQALRLNAMAHRNDVPDRDVERNERWGFAPSFAIGLGSDTRFTLGYLHQHDENVPQYGLPYFAAYGGLLPGVDRESYFGYRNMDIQEIDVDALTGVFEHDFGADTTLRSLARYQKVDQFIVVNPTQGAWCLDSGINPANGAACANPGTYQPSGPRGNTRDSSNAIAVSQTDLTTRFSTGAVEHALVAGVSFTHETYDLDTGNSQRTAAGVAPTYPAMDLHRPDNLYTGPVNYIRSGLTEGELSNQAAYVFDTLKFGPQWQLNLGARYEHNEGSTRSTTFATPAAGGAVSVGPSFVNEDDLFSYRAGLVFKPVEQGTFYLSYANSKTPSKASVNGACTAQTCEVDPETAINLELGSKWSVLDDRLALSAAAFRNERRNYKVASGDPAQPEQQLDGRARVQGLVLGIAGNITRAWSVFANYTYLDSEVLQSVSDHVRDTTGIDAQAGNPLANTPEHSASAWSTYRTHGWTFGYGLTYQGDFVTASTANAPRVKSYTVHRAMAGYQVSDRLSLQLNLNNVFDKQYYTRVRNNGWATPGDARSAVLTATYRF
ncbi:TonB-dependent receptor [Pseudoxanthomonas mexicana]|uniref:TonB-dependent receptor n=1 Tax=Pseudoxanthomonas mexicana TaxID=128785 RepID=UPI00398B118F